MSKSIEWLEEYDLKNLKGETLEYCLAHIITVLIILEKKMDIIYSVLEGAGNGK